MEEYPGSSSVYFEWANLTEPAINKSIKIMPSCHVKVQLRAARIIFLSQGLRHFSLGNFQGQQSGYQSPLPLLPGIEFLAQILFSSRDCRQRPADTFRSQTRASGPTD